MNPNRGEHQQQIEETLPPDQGFERLQEVSIESAANEESGTGKKQASSSSASVQTDLATPSLPVIATTQQDDQAVAATAQSTPVSSTDKDKIEKEWVDRAKSVVARTYDDPHEQKKEMGKVKADYVQKRFNKTIKTDSTATE